LNTSTTDKNWQDVYKHLVSRVTDSETILAPDGFRAAFEGYRGKYPHLGNSKNQEKTSADLKFQNYFASTYLKAEDFNWIIVHKGMIGEINPEFLDETETIRYPVFVNDVFIVFHNKRDWFRPLLKRSPHLSAYHEYRNALRASKPNLQDTRITGTRQDVVLTKKFLRSADVLLCSYPKCGRTWLRFMLASYLHLLSQSSESMDFGRMDQLVPAAWKSKQSSQQISLASKPFNPDIHVARQSKPEHQANYNSEFPLVVATHLSYANQRLQIIFSSKKIIFLIRSIYDVLISQYYELVHRRGDMVSEDIWVYVCEKKLLESYVSYLNHWSTNLAPDRCILLTYEMLKKDTRKEFTRLLRFLSLDINSDYIDRAIALSSFDHMQSLQRQKREKRGIYDDKNQNFARLRIRRGKIGGYRDCLDNSEIQAIQEYCETHLTEAAKELLSAHGLGLKEIGRC